MKSDFYKELYFFEWNRRDQLTAALNVPIGFALVVAGVIAFLLPRFTYAKDWSTYAFVLFLVGAIGSLLWGIYFLIRSYHGYDYGRMPTAGKLRAFFEELRQHYLAAGGSEEDAAKVFEEYLKVRFAEATERNAENNRLKAGRMHSGTSGLIAAFILVGMSLGPYFMKTLGAPERVERLETVKSETSQLGVAMHPVNGGDKDAESAQEQPPAETPSSPDPEPPEGPPIDLIKEDGRIRDAEHR